MRWFTPCLLRQQIHGQNLHLPCILQLSIEAAQAKPLSRAATHRTQTQTCSCEKAPPSLGLEVLGMSLCQAARKARHPAWQISTNQVHAHHLCKTSAGMQHMKARCCTDLFHMLLHDAAVQLQQLRSSMS